MADLSNLKNTISGITSQIKSTTPTDANSDMRLKSLQSDLKVANAKYQSSRWYGDQGDEETMTVEKPAPSLFNRIMDVTATPSRMVVGGAKYLLGKSEEGSLVEAMNANVEKKDTFGDILESYGTPHPVAAVLGFGLDVVTDPMNLIGFGGARRAQSILGKTTAGLVHGAEAEGGRIAAGVAGLKSGLAVRGAKAAKLVPFSKGSAWREGLNVAAEESTKKFEGLMGETALESAFKRSQRTLGIPKSEGGGMGSAQKVFHELRDVFGKKFGEKGLKVWDFIGGKGQITWDNQERMLAAAEKEGLFTRNTYDMGLDGMNAMPIAKQLEVGIIDPVTGARRPAAETSSIEAVRDKPMMKGISEVAGFVDDVEPESRQMFAEIRRMANDGKLVGTDSNNIVRANRFVDLAERMNEEGLNEIKYADLLDLINTRIKTTDGIDVLGLARQKFHTEKIKALDKNDKFKATVLGFAEGSAKMTEVLNGYFKNAVIGVGNSLTSIEGAIIGNPMMRTMMGLPLDKAYWTRRVQSLKINMGKSKPEIIEMIRANPEFMKMAEESPEKFQQVLGFHPLSMTVQGVSNDIAKSMQDLIPKDWEKYRMNPEKFQSDLEAAFKDAGVKVKSNPLERFSQSLTKFEKAFEKEHGRLPTTDEVPSFQKGIGFSSQMIDYGAFHEHRAYVAMRAEKDGGIWKGLNAYLTKPMEWYDLADQTDRFGTLLNLIEDGVPESSLAKLSKFISFTPEDLQKGITGYVMKDGEKYYKLTGDKALDVVTTMYTNYAALPGFIKTMRSIPIAGSPFASFSQAMTAKLIQTMIYSPSDISHLSSLLNEISSNPTPAEEEALKTKYYSYLQDDPTNIRIGELPFFRNNPVYLQAANWNPMGANIFSVSKRKWSDTLKGNTGQFIDSLPIFKTPLGSLIMSYGILPHFLEEGEQAQGVWGQPLVPSNATPLETAGYFARDLVTPYIPKVPSALAGTLTGGNLPEPALQFAPTSYGTAGYAAQGRSSVGAGSKTSITERPSERMVRNILGTLGVNLMPVEPRKPE